MQIPPKRTRGATMKDRLTDNAYDDILPARYLQHNRQGERIEEQEELFERIGQNLAIAEAVWTDETVEITPDVIKPDHPRRDELLNDIFEYYGDVEDPSAELTEENAKWVSYDELVDHLKNEGYDESLGVVRQQAEEFIEKMELLSFMPNSPTLMNAGGELQQLSACFVNSPDDDMDSIHDTAKEAALTFQSGGGMGYAFWRLRPYGDPVGSTGGIASGPITFMRTYDQMCETIAQGGTRRGAQMAIMRVSHPDVIQFIHAKNKDVSLAETLRLNDPDDYRHNSFTEALEEARGLIGEDGKIPDHLRNAAEGHLSNFNISVGMTEPFMEAYQNGEEFTFKNPRTGEPHIASEETKELYEMFDLGEYVEVGEELSIPAGEIFDDIVEGAHENGEPGTVFLDRINDDHSFPAESTPDAESGEYEVLATNPCGEQPLMEYEACNLGHINLSTVVDEDAPDWREFDGSIDEFVSAALDWDELNARVDSGTRMLDNVVTMSAFPIDKISKTVRDNRKVGLGIMGLAQMYVQMGMKYGSDDANEVARQVMRSINHRSKKQSRELAEDRGVFNNHEDSKYADPTSYTDWFERQTGEDAEEWEDGYPIRNHNTTTIAPTGTTSMVGNTSGGCEPIYNVVYRKNVSGDVQGDEMLAEADDYFLRALEANDIDSEAVLKEAHEQIENNEFTGIDGIDLVPDKFKELFVTTGELSALEHAGVQCALQEGVDSAISKTVNAAHDSTMDDAREAFEYVYQNGGKGVTYYRDGTRAKQVITTRADNQALDDVEFAEWLEESEHEDLEAFLDSEAFSDVVDATDLDVYYGEGDTQVGDLSARERPKRTIGETIRIETGYGTMYVTINEDKEGLHEVFATIGKSGGFTESMVEGLARTVSLSLRIGADPREIIRQLEDIKSPQTGWDEGQQISSIPDGIATALETYLESEDVGDSIIDDAMEAVEESSMDVSDTVSGEPIQNGGSKSATSEIVSRGHNPECPECGAMLEISEGCEKCPNGCVSKC